MLRLSESKKSEGSWDLKTFDLGPKHRSREVFASVIFFPSQFLELVARGFGS